MNRNEGMYQQIFDVLPIGLFLIDENHQVFSWNAWMSINTGITRESAIGQSIKTLFPEQINPRFDWALDAVLQHGHPQWLSSILNQFLIPISIAKKSYSNLNMMQQNIEIVPFYFNEKNMALVIVQDVSEKIYLKNILMSMAKRFEEYSIIDALTGLYNRRFLWKYLDNELKTAEREGYRVFCCIYDLDYFKKINDEFGHSAGDEVLVSFVRLVVANIRPPDFFIRYGGEEFIALFTRITVDGAVKLANRIRTLLEKKPSHGSVNKKITCSGGLAYWQPTDSPISAEELVNQADLELYKAKNKGRNCIVVSNKP